MPRTSEGTPKRDREAFESPCERRLTAATQPSGERAAPAPAGLPTGMPAVLDNLRSAAADFAARAESTLRVARRIAQTEARVSEHLIAENLRLKADVAARDETLTQLIERLKAQKVKEQALNASIVKLAVENEELHAAARLPPTAVALRVEPSRLLTPHEAAKRALANDY